MLQWRINVPYGRRCSNSLVQSTKSLIRVLTHGRCRCQSSLPSLTQRDTFILIRHRPSTPASKLRSREQKGRKAYDIWRNAKSGGHSVRGARIEVRYGLLNSVIPAPLSMHHERYLRYIAVIGLWLCHSATQDPSLLPLTPATPNAFLACRNQDA